LKLSVLLVRLERVSSTFKCTFEHVESCTRIIELQKYTWKHWLHSRVRYSLDNGSNDNLIVARDEMVPRRRDAIPVQTGMQILSTRIS